MYSAGPDPANPYPPPPAWGQGNAVPPDYHLPGQYPTDHNPPGDQPQRRSLARSLNPEKLLGVAVAVLGGLNFIFGFLPQYTSGSQDGNLSVYSVGPGYIPILLLIAGLLALAAFVPGSERSRLAVAAVSVGGAVGAVISVGTTSPGTSSLGTGLGAILLTIFGIVQAVIAIGGFVVGAGVLPQAEQMRSADGSGTAGSANADVLNAGPTGPTGGGPWTGPGPVSGWPGRQPVPVEVQSSGAPSNRPASGQQSYPASPNPVQALTGQTLAGQVLAGRPYSAPLFQGQPQPAAPFQGQSFQGPSFQGPSLQGQSYPDQSYPGRPFPGPSAAGQVYPSQPFAGQPSAEQSSSGHFSADRPSGAQHRRVEPVPAWSRPPRNQPDPTEPPTGPQSVVGVESRRPSRAATAGTDPVDQQRPFLSGSSADDRQPPRSRSDVVDLAKPAEPPATGNN